MIQGSARRIRPAVLAELGDEVDRWVTLNEPSVLAFMGYAGRRWPPGLGDPGAKPA